MKTVDVIFRLALVALFTGTFTFVLVIAGALLLTVIRGNLEPNGSSFVDLSFIVRRLAIPVSVGVAVGAAVVMAFYIKR